MKKEIKQISNGISNIDNIRKNLKFKPVDTNLKFIDHMSLICSEHTAEAITKEAHCFLFDMLKKMRDLGIEVVQSNGEPFDFKKD